MNYTKLISKKKQYKYSVNICLDLRAEERLADFIPNLTTTEIIREYLGGIIRGNADTHSRILYGSYGTGKSHLLTVMSAILGHINISGKGFKSFTRLIANYDEELSMDICTFAMEEKPYMVVPVYADYDDFGKCITFSLKKELEKNNISVCFKDSKKNDDKKLKEESNLFQKTERSLKEVLKEVLGQKDFEKTLPIIEYLETKSSITTQKAKQITGKSSATAWRYIQILVKAGVLESDGNTNNAEYILRL